jgi:protein-L-isoaspartate(D-aspartate) O-methyltransferase
MSPPDSRDKRGPKFPLRLDQFAAPPIPGPGPRPRAVAPTAHALPTASPPAKAQGGAPRRLTPAGLGLDSADVRARMAHRLRGAGIGDPRVLAVMAEIPRHLFVDAALVTQAYEDTSLPIGHGQTISKPSVVARMVELLMDGTSARRSGGLGRTLEIGTGCGYQAAVLAALAKHVVSVERLRPLHDKARELLASLRPSHLRLVYGDGTLGHPPNAPYDSIIAAAGGDSLPAAWLDQLAPGGRLVSPLRQGGGERQVLMVVDRTDHGYVRTAYEAVHFVPLKSGLVG